MPSSKAAVSEEARRTLRYGEPLSDTRTMLADFFSILLERKDRSMLDEVKNRVQTVKQLVSELRGHL